MKKITSQPDPKAVLALIAIAAAFGGAFVFMKVLADEISTFEIVAGRLTLGAAVLVIVIALRGQKYTMTFANARRVGLLAIVDTVIPFSLVAWAETRIDAGLASLLISTMPIFTVVIAMTFLADERRSPVRLTALPLGATGLVVLTGGDVLSIGNANAIAQLAVVGGALAYGIGAVYSKVLLRTMDPIDLSVTKIAIGAAIASVLVVPTAGAPGYDSLSAEGWASLTGLGVVSTALAFTLYLWLVGRAGSVYSSMVTYVIPVFGVLLAWAVLGESVGPSTAAGAALIGAAIAAVMYGQRIFDALWQRLAQPRPVETLAQQTAQVTVAEEYA